MFVVVCNDNLYFITSAIPIIGGEKLARHVNLLSSFLPDPNNPTFYSIFSVISIKNPDHPRRVLHLFLLVEK